MRVRRACAPLLLLATCPSGAVAQIGVAVEGRVLDAATERPIAQAVVTAISETGDTLFYSQTNETGLYFIPQQESATRYRIAVEALGFTQEIGEVLSGADERQYWVIRLDPKPVEREGLIVEVERQTRGLRRFGFYDRRRIRAGIFVDEGEVDRLKTPFLGDIFRRSTGMRVTARGEPYSVRAQGTGVFQAPCLPTVWVDGALARAGGDPVPDRVTVESLEFIAPPPSQVAGMEFYHGGATVPAEFAGANSRCGVLVVWTKR